MLLCWCLHSSPRLLLLSLSDIPSHVLLHRPPLLTITRSKGPLLCIQEACMSLVTLACYWNNNGRSSLGQGGPHRSGCYVIHILSPSKHQCPPHAASPRVRAGPPPLTASWASHGSLPEHLLPAERTLHQRHIAGVDVYQPAV